MNANSGMLTALCLALAAVAPIARGADNPKTVSLLNGKDLSGWKPIGKGSSQ
jgi:hypothetical protein